MARYVDVIDLPVPAEQAFDYLADFRRTAEWDPGVAAAVQLTPGAVGLGTGFRVTLALARLHVPFEYRITEYQRPSRVVLVGEGDALRSIDEITFVPRPGGTRVTYEARLELFGVRRLVDPFLDALFQHIGRRAVRGLRRQWDADVHADAPAHEVSVGTAGKGATSAHRSRSDATTEGFAP